MDPADHATNAVLSDWKPESETCCNHCFYAVFWTGSYFFEKEVSRWVVVHFKLPWFLDITQFLTLGQFFFFFFFGLAYQGQGYCV
jgi:hypothetical protein